ncbi:hypothetical protein MAR_019073 [Mya arenaria]|uniref:Uncharacterized protein n=1 Tax=Mya arenaria TaxID=6604 RepID=A0ABY7EJ12_MYAAR|nr:hypothetical protein MAR_019073 [Mya arenaria]
MDIPCLQPTGSAVALKARVNGAFGIGFLKRFCPPVFSAKGIPRNLDTVFGDEDNGTRGCRVGSVPYCCVSQAAVSSLIQRKGKGGGGRRPRPLMRQAKFCKGLVNGNITNDDATFDAVFTDVTSACDDLLQFLEDNKPVGDDTEGGEGEGEREEPTSVEKLLNFCDGVEKFEPTDNAPEGLQEILDEFQTPCDTARNLAGEDDGAEEEEA